MEVQKYMTVKEAAKRFGVSTPTIYRWLNQRIIKAYKIGGRTLLKIEEAENAMVPIQF